QGPGRCFAREVELAAVDGNPGDRKVVLGDLDSVLEREIAASSGMFGGELPACLVELDERELPEDVRASQLVALSPALVLSLEKSEPGLIPDRNRSHVRHLVLDPRLSGLARQLDRLGGERRSILVADSSAKIGESGQRSHVERDVVKTL